MFYIGLYCEKLEKFFLSKTIRPSVLIFGMYYHLLDLYQVCSNYVLGVKNGPTRGSHVFHRFNYIVKNMKKSSCLKSFGIESGYLVCCII